jgi:hypothetical protein
MVLGGTGEGEAADPDDDPDDGTVWVFAIGPHVQGSVRGSR